MGVRTRLPANWGNKTRAFDERLASMFQNQPDGSRKQKRRKRNGKKKR
jgi:hypothetical protein